MAQTTAATTATHHHPPHLKHYFVSSEQQFDAAKMGMWLFLVTEILLFSGMFVAYAAFRYLKPEVFELSSQLLNPWMGGINTIVLLASSLTVALSIHYAQRDDRRKVVLNLLLTLAFAATFMVIKYFEYTDKFSHGIFPGGHFHPHEAYAAYNVPYANIFFSIYFVMTGIHGVHVLIGMGLFTWLLRRAQRGDFNSEYFTPIELTGLYWHLVDIIWIFLFPLLYLI